MYFFEDGGNLKSCKHSVWQQSELSVHLHWKYIEAPLVAILSRKDKTTTRNADSSVEMKLSFTTMMLSLQLNVVHHRGVQETTKTTEGLNPLS
jgi:hypothetical protein